MPTIYINVNKYSFLYLHVISFSIQPKPSPVALRAQTLKAEIRDLENLRLKLEEREALIKVVFS